MKKISIFFVTVISLLCLLNLWDNPRDLTKIDCITDECVDAWGLLQKAMFKKEVYDASEYRDVFLLANNFACTKDTDTRMDAFYQGVNEGKALADALGAKFLFVNAPVKQIFYEIPVGVVDFSAEKYEAAIQYLESEDVTVDYIDMKKVFEEEETDYASLYYSSDHHWNSDGAWVCYQKISAWLSDNGFVQEENALQESNYTKEIFEKTHLGSSGRFAGKYYGGVDDYELWTPDFETRFTYTIPSTKENVEGNFVDCIVHYENVEGANYGIYGYYAFFGSDRDFTEIENENALEGMPHVVIVKDSYAIPVSAFLINECSELDMVDLRYVGEHSAKSYIASKKPDVIIYLFEPGSFGMVDTMVIK